MSEESESLNEEDRSVFRPFTRESIAAIEARIAEENAKKKELQKKKEEDQVGSRILALSSHNKLMEQGLLFKK